jgi:2-hydroxy-6-oxonona-2,4-dienedioate hydrolase
MTSQSSSAAGPTPPASPAAAPMQPVPSQPVPSQAACAQALAQIAAIDAHARIERVDHGGRVICWRRFGAGPPLVLLHGGHGSWLHWLRNVEALAARHTVLLPDLPSFGDSDDLDGDPKAEDRLERLVEGTVATLDRLVGTGTPIDLAGFSFGGLVASQIVASRGGVRRLVLLGPGGHGTARRQTVALVNWRLPDPAQRAAALHANLRSFMLHRPQAADPLAHVIHALSCEKTRFRSKELSRDDTLTRLLGAFEGPLLGLWGEFDVTGHPDRIGPLIAGRHAQREWRVVPQAGHWVQYEQAEAVDRELVRWFGG